MILIIIIIIYPFKSFNEQKRKDPNGSETETNRPS